MSPFFSVVIPSYNRAHCLLQTINSVVNQRFENWEIILVDDGSTDKTADLFNEITDSRIFYFYKENGERGAARNYGVSKARGEYIFFLDSDDLIKENYLQEAFEMIRSTKARCIHIPYNYLINEIEYKGPNLSGNPSIYQLRQNHFACQIIIHKSCFAQFRFSENPDFKIGEDWYFILLLLSRFEFKVATQSLGLIVQHHQRTMREAPASVVLQSLEIFEDELLRHHPNPQNVLPSVKHELLNLAALHASMEKKRKMALSLMIKSLKYSPGRFMRWRNIVICKKVLLGA